MHKGRDIRRSDIKLTKYGAVKESRPESNLVADFCIEEFPSCTAIDAVVCEQFVVSIPLSLDIYIYMC